MKKKSRSGLHLIAYGLILTLILALAPFTIPQLFGYEPYGILSNSMEPTLPVGSVIYVKSYEPSKLKEGDMITFQTSILAANVATHRIVHHDQTKQRFTTKGDHNDAIDASFVPYENVRGIVVICIPYLGEFYQFVNSPLGYTLSSFAILLACILWCIPNHKKSNK